MCIEDKLSLRSPQIPKIAFAFGQFEVVIASVDSTSKLSGESHSQSHSGM
jgi:hypothetical protein